jgi:hypothetical protein
MTPKDESMLAFNSKDTEQWEEDIATVFSRWDTGVKAIPSIYRHVPTRPQRGRYSFHPRMYVASYEPPEFQADFCIIMAKGDGENREFKIVPVPDPDDLEDFCVDGSRPWQVEDKPFVDENDRRKDDRKSSKPKDVFTLNRPCEDVPLLFSIGLSLVPRETRTFIQNRLQEALATPLNPGSYPQTSDIISTSVGHAIQWARPRRVGPGWGGWDDSYRWQGAGLSITKDMIPSTEWKSGFESVFKFVDESGEVTDVVPNVMEKESRRGPETLRNMVPENWPGQVEMDDRWNNLSDDPNTAPRESRDW